MNRIYKTIRNRGASQTIVASEFAKGNKKSLSGKILALSVAGILAGASISSAQATIVTNANNFGLDSLQDVLTTQVISGDSVNFNSNINPTDISAIKITQTDVTI